MKVLSNVLILATLFLSVWMICAIHVCVCNAKSFQSWPTLCNSMDCSHPGSSVHGILQAKIWSGLPCPSPEDLTDPGIEPVSLRSPALADRLYLQCNENATVHIGKPIHAAHLVQFSHPVMYDSLWTHGLQHDRLPCPSTTPGAYSNSCPSSQWCHPTISSSVVPFSSRPQSFPATGSFPRSQFFASGGQSIGVSASTSVLPMNTQDWSPLGWTGWISLQSKGLSRVFSNTTVQKH